MTRWFVLLAADGAICQQIAAVDVDAAARENDWQIDRVAEIERPGDTALEVLTGAGWHEDAAKVETMLLEALQERYLGRLSDVMTPGKEAVYQAKADEIARWTAGATDHATLPFASAEAAARGMAIEDVLLEYLDGMDASRQGLARIEAEWQAAKAAVTAARSAQDKRAAFGMSAAKSAEGDDGR